MNAHEQIEWEKSLVDSNGNPTFQALHPRSLELAIEIAKNQLKFDNSYGMLRKTTKKYIEDGKSEFSKYLRRDSKISVLLESGSIRN